MRKSYKGFFKPKNPEKYQGDSNEIVYRSLLEKRFFVLIDETPSFKKWSSETVVIPYVHPVDGKIHRYFMDLIVEMEDGRKILIEIKPHSQISPPKPPKKNPNNSQRYINECVTYAINKAKWDATDVFCKKYNLEFMFWTEKMLPKVLNG